MPVLSTLNNAIVPLSSSWTHEKVLSTVRALTNEMDSETIQNHTIRFFINLAVSDIAEMLRLANQPFYNIDWVAITEVGTTNGLQWIDLTAAVVSPVPGVGTGQVAFPTPPTVAATQFIPRNQLADIDRLTTAKSLDALIGIQLSDRVLITNCKKANVADIVNLTGDFNDQYRQSIVYEWRGDKILLFFGSEIDQTDPTFNTLAPGTEYKIPMLFVIWGNRLPLLDNLLPEDNAASTYRSLVDIPDRHARLLILMVQKQVLESIGKQMQPAAVQELTALTSQITQNVMAQPQVEQAQNEQDKHSSGLPSR